MTNAKVRYLQLKARFRDSFAQKHADLAASWAVFCMQPEASPAREQVQHLVHRLSGSAGAYGFAAVGVIARRIDTALATWQNAPIDARLLPAELADSLRVDMQQLLAALSIGLRPGNTDT